MDLTDTHVVVTVVCALAIVAGIAGVVVPGLPALPLCWAGVLVWAIFGGGGWARWPVLGAVTAIALTGTVVKYAWPGRNLRRSGVPSLSLLAGGAVGLVGFFVVPIVGLPIGFVLGIWLAEWARLGDARRAWPSTRQAVRAAGLSMLIELGAALLVAAVWVLGLVLA